MNHTRANSAVIPVHIGPCYRVEAPYAAINQPLDDFECFAGHDASTDDSQSIPRSPAAEGPRIRDVSWRMAEIVDVLHDEADPRGRCVATVGASDFAEPARFERQFPTIETHPAFLAAGSRDIKSPGRVAWTHCSVCERPKES